eukprot:15365639-Ditylum_brightwellii.AAC.2
MYEERNSKEEERIFKEEITGGVAEQVSSLERGVALLLDTLAAIKGQKDAGHMVVEIGGNIFKVKKDVNIWMQENLPSNFPFGVFVDVYVIMEIILTEHSDLQVNNMV